MSLRKRSDKAHIWPPAWQEMKNLIWSIFLLFRKFYEWFLWVLPHLYTYNLSTFEDMRLKSGKFLNFHKICRNRVLFFILFQFLRVLTNLTQNFCEYLDRSPNQLRYPSVMLAETFENHENHIEKKISSSKQFISHFCHLHQTYFLCKVGDQTWHSPFIQYITIALTTPPLLLS